MIRQDSAVLLWVASKDFLCQIKTFYKAKIAQKGCLSVSISFLIVVIIQQMMFE